VCKDSKKKIKKVLYPPSTVTTYHTGTDHTTVTTIGKNSKVKLISIKHIENLISSFKESLAK